MNIEVTLNGFDGGSDETDNLVKWISAPNQAMVERYIDETGLRPHVQSVIEIREDTNLTFADGIDIILSDHSHAQSGEVKIAPSLSTCVGVELWAFSIEGYNKPEDWINESRLVLT
jgi:hypothetical protein